MIMRFILLLTLCAAASGSLKYRNNLDAKSRLAQRSCGTSTEGHDDNSLGPHIVHLMDHIKHDEFEQNLRKLQEDQYPFTASTVKAFVSHRHYHALHGLTVEGITAEEIRGLPGVKKVVAESYRHILRQRSPVTPDFSILAAALPPPIDYDKAVFPPWGIDRLNQPSLPLDSSYKTEYTGIDVDVFIIDTGLDTQHIEFAQRPGDHVRTIKNLYDAFGPSPDSPSINTDGEGHGTHVAGTIGGNNVGVSRDCNILALKALADAGEGTVSDILNAMDRVITYAKTSGRRSVISMSFGGPCEQGDCPNDTLVQAVGTLTSKNIAVSVAAGNEGCNACRGSPNSAPSAINVGATDIEDKVSYFSDIGSCIDVFAPGFNIMSACASNACNTVTSYVLLSGTSMACPHVTGVVAQLLEKNHLATPADVQKAISCDGAKGQLTPDPKDSVSRNLILQVPLRKDDFGKCNLGVGCSAECSGKGMCLPVRIDHAAASSTLSPTRAPTDSFALSTAPTEVRVVTTASPSVQATTTAAPSAFISELTFSPTATTISFTPSTAPSPATPPLILIEPSYSPSYAPSRTQTISYAPSTAPSLGSPFMMSGTPTEGPVTISASASTSEMLLSGNSLSFSAYVPSSSLYCHCDTGWYGPSCTLTAPPMCIDNSIKMLLILYDSYGDGWTFANYAITNADTGMIVDGAFDSMCSGKNDMRSYCVTPGKYKFDLSRGIIPSEISWKMCGVTGGAPFTGTFTVDAKGDCSMTCGDDSSSVMLSMFDSYGNGWDNAYYNVYTQDGKLLYGGNLPPQLQKEGANELCLIKNQCSIIMMELLGLEPGEVSYSICGFTANVNDVVSVCLSASGVCTAKPFKTDTCKGGVNMYMFDTSNKGWRGSYYELLKGVPAYNTQALSTVSSPLVRAPHSYDEHMSLQGEHAMGVVKTYTGTLKDGFIGADPFCNLEGCYRLNVDLATQNGVVDTATAKTIASTSFFSVCGHRGRIPFSAPLCIDPVYGVCYGVTGCPVLKSYAKRSSRLNAFISYDMLGKETFVENLAVRGIRELCTLKPMCYKVVVTGRNDSNGLFDLCGTTVQAPAMGTLCVDLNAQNNTVCTSNTMKTTVCPAITVGGVTMPQTSILIVKYAREGMGWGDEVNYNIFSVGSTEETPAVYTGTLRDGSMGTDALCLPVGQCFIFFADFDPMDPFGLNTNIWIMCGFVGSLPVENMKFCVTSSGCAFDNADVDEGYKKYTDDDAITKVSRTPTRAPTPALPPSSVPSPYMFVQVDVTMQVSLMAAKKGTTTAFNTHTTTTSTTTSSSSSVLPVVPSMDRLPIMTMTGAGAGLQSTMEAYDHSNLNVTFVCQAVHRVLQQAGMLIWNVTASSASYTPTTSPSSLSLSLSSSFLSDKDTVVTTLGIEGEEEGEEGEEDVSAIFSHRRMEDKGSSLVMQTATLRTSLVAGIRVQDGMTAKDMMVSLNRTFGYSVVNGGMQTALDRALGAFLDTFKASKSTPHSLHNMKDSKSSMDSQQREHSKSYMDSNNGRYKKSKRDISHFTVSEGTSAPARVASARIQSVAAVKDIRIVQSKPSDAPSTGAFNDVFPSDMDTTSDTRSQRSASGNTMWYLALAGAFIFIGIGMVIVASKRCNSPASTAPMYNPLDVSTSSAMILDGNGGSTNHAGGWLDIEGAAAARTRAARQDQLSDVGIVTVNFNVLHDPASTSTLSSPSKALPKASLPSSTSSSSTSTALPNSSPSSSSSSSAMGGKTPAPILNTALYLNKLKQSTPSEGKNWWVNNEEKQGEGNEKDKDAVDGNSASGEAKQGRRESEDFSYGAKNVSDDKDIAKEKGGEGG